MDIILLDGTVLVTVIKNEDDTQIVSIPGMLLDEELNEWVEVPLPEPHK